jgi:hypothetical protein
MKHQTLLCCSLGILLLSQTTFGSDNEHSRSLQQNNPLLFAQIQQLDDADSYKAWYDANAANDLPKAFELAKKYLKDFPNGKNAVYLQSKWLPNARARLFNQAYVDKNTEAMLALGNEELATNPDNLNFLLALARHLNVNEVNAKPPITTHATEAEAYTRHAVKLLEEGKKPAEGTGWNVNETLNYFYQILGGVEERNKNPDVALAFYEKAAALDANNAFTYFHSGAIYQARYIKAAEKYQALPEADRAATPPSAPTAALLKDVNDAADVVLDRWIKFLKLTATNNTFGASRAEVETTVAELYKYRHPESPEGFRELIKP